MQVRKLGDDLSVAPQIAVADIAALAAQGYRSLICNRPDGEGADQPLYEEIARAAEAAGLKPVYLPIESGKVDDAAAQRFGELLCELPKPVFAYCRTGTRSATLWALAQVQRRPLPEILDIARVAGYDLAAVARRIANGGRTPVDRVDARHQIVIIGGGAAGIATAASLLSRDAKLDIAIIDPADVHYYQPGWTLVGAGVFKPSHTARTMASLIPRGVHWIKAAVAAFEPRANAVVLDGCRVVGYDQLVICPGLKLNWAGIEGLDETLGRNGVTSNYRYDLAPYTWDLVQKLREGRALFTQPPMPIKCAGAPQKAMYLSCDHWRREGVLAKIEPEFYNAGGVLFGVADYVPALMHYVERYGIDLNFGHTLVKVDGARRIASFARNRTDGTRETVEREFDFLHVVPPQVAPDFLRVSPFADAAGWVDVDPASLRHRQFGNVHALGDCTNTSNAKTAAAARKQAPVVAHNVLAALGRARTEARYDGYGSCPLTVERGKIVLAEFTYGGKLAPSFPSWLLDGRKPTRAAWWLKERVLPPLYWQAMLKGREWMAQPELAD
ncbi:bifunctional protein tyrosine phosphatase family protein/NAD(P)/FAD-dependent oxidoreductase [Solimonas terrae]|uniref:TIGR01244 family phosphatase n=1 Tax=Solimonas terrae TaxID=1396819 RepID=A0A6M2BLK7_9GAMM|nr:bifunctional protein tyrosine phosphatase family protein/NAD(P)/FAD-dependent oxidoreductase [Solimonas terrae]NGY03220.1 TIGR01244 family phosphatase [Solimonas terrae]